MDHDRKGLTREQFHETLQRIDTSATGQRAALAAERERSDGLFAEERRRYGDLVARLDRKCDRITILILTTWLSSLATELYLHLRQ